MEKRKVRITIGGQICIFYSDDSDEYISALEQRANAAMKQTAGFSGPSAYTNAILAVLTLTDQLLRTEQTGSEQAGPERTEAPAGTEQKSRKNSAKAARKDEGQVSVWDLLDRK